MEAFELAVELRPGDIDELGHVNNVVYLRWVQEAAVAHWYAVASAADQTSLVWVVLRHEIDYKLAAVQGDRIVARTWTGSASGLRFERHTEIVREADRKVLAVAKTIWCPLDAHTRRPTVPSASFRQWYAGY